MSDLCETFALFCCMRCSGKTKDERDLEADESAQAVSERWRMEGRRQVRPAGDDGSAEGVRRGEVKEGAMARQVHEGDAGAGAEEVQVAEQSAGSVRQQRGTRLIQLTEAQRKEVREDRGP